MSECDKSASSQPAPFRTVDSVVNAIQSMKDEDQVEVLARLRGLLKSEVLAKAGIRAPQKSIRDRMTVNFKKIGWRLRPSSASTDPREELFQYLVDKHWNGRDEDADGWNLLPNESDLIAMERVPADTEEMHERWAEVQQGWRNICKIPKDELRQLMYEVGLLAKHRYTLWKDWLGPFDTKVDYFTLCEDAPRELPAGVKKQIEVDLPRTLAKVLKKEVHHDPLRRVLQSYALHNKEVGYCQSMNVIGGVLLYLGFEEEESFSMLCQLLGERLCNNYHHPSLSNLLIDMSVCETLIAEVVPRVLPDIEACGLDVLFFAVDPFLCLFAHTLPLTSLFRVWDVLIFEKTAGLFAIFLAFLQLNYKAGVFSSVNADEVINNWNIGVKRLAMVKIDHVLTVARSLIDSNIVTAARIQELRASPEAKGLNGRKSCRSPRESVESDSSLKRSSSAKR